MSPVNSRAEALLECGGYRPAAIRPLTRRKRPMSLLDLRDRIVLAATFWKRQVVNDGVRLSLRDASPRMHFALVTGDELEDSRLARKVLNPTDRVLELGSSIGFMALLCQTQIGIEDYAMVEANPRLAALIAENFRLNDAGHPLLFTVAAGPEDGTVRFHLNRDYWSSSVLERANERDTITVPQRSIPSLVAELPFTPNVLIVDIEGGETRIPTEHWLLFDTIIGEFHERLVGTRPIARITDGLRHAGSRRVARKGQSHAYARELRKAA